MSKLATHKPPYVEGVEIGGLVIAAVFVSLLATVPQLVARRMAIVESREIDRFSPSLRMIRTNHAQARGESVNFTRLNDGHSARDQLRYGREKRDEYRCDDESTNFHPLNVGWFVSSKFAHIGRVGLSNLTVSSESITIITVVTRAPPVSPRPGQSALDSRPFGTQGETVVKHASLSTREHDISPKR